MYFNPAFHPPNPFGFNPPHSKFLPNYFEPRKVPPPGISALLCEFNKIYPSQSNPIQITTVLKYWLGGQEPLDYISIYENSGSEIVDGNLTIPPHWHYVSYGLSDLYGDNRIHIIDTASSEPISGMGFELTFRLKKNPRNPDEIPPSWPAALMQSLAKYVFTSKNCFFQGDHIPWDKSLDGKDSKIQHMLIAEDAQLKERIRTPHGFLSFCQIVGVTKEEVEQAARLNGKSILNLLKQDPKTGGNWLLTDMDRVMSVFDLFPQTIGMLEDELEKSGSDLAGVDAEFYYRELPKTVIKTSLDLSVLTMDSGKSMDFKHLGRSSSKMMTDSSDGNLSYHSTAPPYVGFLHRRLIVLDGVELSFSPATAKFLKIALKDRIRHGRHFTFKSPDLHLTFVSEAVEGCFVSRDNPFCIQGKWMQILIGNDLLPSIIDALKELDTNNIEKIPIPKVFDFPEKNLRFIINHLSSSFLR